MGLHVACARCGAPAVTVATIGGHHYCRRCRDTLGVCHYCEAPATCAYEWPGRLPQPQPMCDEHAATAAMFAGLYAGTFGDSDPPRKVPA